jgi:hypothetical protein
MHSEVFYAPTLSLSKGRTFWSGSGPAGRRDHRRTHLDGTRAKFSESPRSGGVARGFEREIGKAAAARGDSEKTSTISVRWEKLPS